MTKAKTMTKTDLLALLTQLPLGEDDPIWGKLFDAADKLVAAKLRTLTENGGALATVVAFAMGTATVVEPAAKPKPKRNWTPEDLDELKRQVLQALVDIPSGTGATATELREWLHQKNRGLYGGPFVSAALKLLLKQGHLTSTGGRRGKRYQLASVSAGDGEEPLPDSDPPPDEPRVTGNPDAQD
jgi:hypothetical protein